MKKILVAAFVISILLSVVASPGRAQAPSPEQTLNQYVADLQKNPNDYALREKIIKHVQTMKPEPAVPEEARRHFIEGNALLKAAKDQKGYGLALDAYRQCLLVAPWWAEAYYNYGAALDLTNRFDDAVTALKLYIATNPGEAESRKAQDKIYEIGAKKKLAAMEKTASSSQTAAVPKQDPFEALLKKIDGRRYTWGQASGSNTMQVIDVRGRVFVQGWIGDPNYSGTRGYHEDTTGRVEIKGRETVVPSSRILTGPWKGQWSAQMTYIIGEDGDRITVRARWRDGDVREYVYLWQR